MGWNPISALSDNIRVDTDKCIGCGVCVDRCILDNLRLQQAPCAHACPLGINAQGYVQLIARGDLEGAAERIYEKTPFIGLLGYLCDHPCEGRCSHHQADGTGVSIRALKRYLYEHAPKAPDLAIKAVAKGRCAVVGGGPAGMSAAWSLAKAGCHVAVFEEGDTLGGTLARAVPEFRLPSRVVERECALLTALGVAVHTGVRVGRDVALQEIIASYDAIFLATGTTVPARTPQARDCGAGVLYALDFLTRAKRSPLPMGGEVVVVGGGDVAVDAALTARRSGAERVTLLSLEQLDGLPASADSIREAREEGVAFQPGWGVASIREQGGMPAGLLAKQCVRVFDREGRFSPLYDEAVVREIPAQRIILAVGQCADLSYSQEAGIALEGGRIQVDPVSLRTSVEKVFAGGDTIAGANTAVHAMADGTRAAESILLYLNGDDLSYGRDNSTVYLHDFPVDLTSGSQAPRVDLMTPGAARAERSMTDEEAGREAGRCLNCGKPIGYRRTCWMCLPCEVECPQKALEVGIHYIMA